MPCYPEKGQSRLRKNRFSIEGGYYFVTFSLVEKRVLLTDRNLADTILRRFLEEGEGGKITPFCCMVMPDHVHLVFELHRGDIGEIIRKIKGSSAHEINLILNRQGPLWNKQYYEHKIRAEESYRKIVRYCYENPLRKLFVENSKDWPFWWCAWKME